MAELTIIFAVIIVLAVCGMAGIFLIKSPRMNKIIFILLVILTITISAMSAMALPSNYVMKQVLAWSWSGVAIVGTVLYFMSTNQRRVSKYVLVLGTIGALMSLLVM